MKNILIIVCDPNINTDLLNDRIHQLGPTYTFWGNHWLLETDMSSKDVYNKISEPYYGDASLFIMPLTSRDHSYYGRMKTSLWDWLVRRENK